MKEPKQHRSQRTLERLKRAAIELFEQHGVDATGMSQIAERADSSVGSIYGRFEGKTELVESVDQLLWDRVLSRWRDSDAGSEIHGELDGELRRTETEVLLADLWRAMKPERRARSSTAGYLSREGVDSAARAARQALEEDVIHALSNRVPAATEGGSADATLRYVARLVVTEVASTESGDSVPEELCFLIEAALAALSGAPPPLADPSRPRQPATDPFDIWA